MQKGKIRDMFPGGNSSLGFFSYYDYILPQDKANRIFIIKGGPGVGKSTFMKKTGIEMLEKGYDVEFMHCSSDNNSLDGIVIPKLGIAMIDGTAPHVVDPKNPGAVDEIIHLGDFWNVDGFSSFKEEIKKINGDVSALFARAYKYLRAARCIYEDMCDIYGKALNEAIINNMTHKLQSEIFGAGIVAERPGRLRKLFVSAITPDGFKAYPDTIIAGNKVYRIKDLPSMKSSKIIERIKDVALEAGYDAEGYYCALIPDKLEHLVIPSLGVAVSTSNLYHDFSKAPIMELDYSRALDSDIIQNSVLTLEYDRYQFDELLKAAVDTISKAKSLHDLMERYYIPNMNFEAVQNCWEKTIKRFL